MGGLWWNLNICEYCAFVKLLYHCCDMHSTPIVRSIEWILCCILAWCGGKCMASSLIIIIITYCLLVCRLYRCRSTVHTLQYSSRYSIPPKTVWLVWSSGHRWSLSIFRNHRKIPFSCVVVDFTQIFPWIWITGKSERSTIECYYLKPNSHHTLGACQRCANVKRTNNQTQIENAHVVCWCLTLDSGLSQISVITISLKAWKLVLRSNNRQPNEVHSHTT